MKKLLHGIIIAAFLVCPLVAQEEQTEKSTRILGGISDGKSSSPVKPKPAPDFTIFKSKVYHRKGQKIVFNKVAALPPQDMMLQPVQQLSSAEIARRNKRIEKWVSDIKESGGFFTVSATIYDHKTTYVRWWNGKVEYAAYSNVDWNRLGGFMEFTGRGKRFNMIMFSSNISKENMLKEKAEGYRLMLPGIPELPALPEHGAAYMVVKGDESNDSAMEFIEAIHDLYDEHQAELAKAWREREKNHQSYLKRQQALKLNPSPKPPLVINWTLRKNGVEKQDEKTGPIQKPSGSKEVKQ